MWGWPAKLARRMRGLQLWRGRAASTPHPGIRVSEYPGPKREIPNSYRKSVGFRDDGWLGHVGVLVFLQQPVGLLQGVAAEGVAQLLRHQHLQHGGLALLLGGNGLLQRLSDVAQVLHHDAFRTQRARN